MKRFLTLILAAAMLLSIAGCGDYIIMKKSDFKVLRDNIEVDLPALDALMAKKFRGGTMTPAEYMEYQSRRGPYNLWLADIAKKIDSSGDLFGSVENLVRMAGYGQYVDLLGGGGSSAVDPAIINRLEAMERIAKENNVTMQQVSKDLLTMKGWIKDGYKEPEKPDPEPEPEPEKPEPEDPDPEPEPEKPVIISPVNRNIIFQLDEHVYKDEQPIVHSLDGLNINDWYVEFWVENAPYNAGRPHIIIPFLTITDGNNIEKFRRSGKFHRNAGRISFTIFSSVREAQYAGMINLFWASDKNRDEKLEKKTPEDKEGEFEEWRTKTNVDWLSPHKLRFEFKSVGDYEVKATIFLDGRKINSREAVFYCPKPVLVLPSHLKMPLKWVQPVGMVVSELVIGNLER